MLAMGSSTADDTGQGLRPAGLAKVARQARSQAGKTRARPAPVAWHVGADQQQPAADVNRLPHHPRRLPAADGGQPGGVSVLRLGPADRGPVKAEHVQAMQEEFEGLLRRFNDVMARSQANREQIRQADPGGSFCTIRRSPGCKPEWPRCR